MFVFETGSTHIFANIRNFDTARRDDSNFSLFGDNYSLFICINVYILRLLNCITLL